MKAFRISGMLAREMVTLSCLLRRGISLAFRIAEGPGDAISASAAFLSECSRIPRQILAVPLFRMSKALPGSRSGTDLPRRAVHMPAVQIFEYWVFTSARIQLTLEQPE